MINYHERAVRSYVELVRATTVDDYPYVVTPLCIDGVASGHDKDANVYDLGASILFPTHITEHGLGHVAAVWSMYEIVDTETIRDISLGAKIGREALLRYARSFEMTGPFMYNRSVRGQGFDPEIARDLHLSQRHLPLAAVIISSSSATGRPLANLFSPDIAWPQASLAALQEALGEGAQFIPE